MRKSSLFFGLLFISTLLTIPQADAQQYKNGLVDKVVALVGDEMITLSAIEQEVKIESTRGMLTDKNLRCIILENMLIQKLLLNQAKIDSLNVDEASVDMELESQLNEIKSRLGGENQTEQYFGKPIFKLKQDWYDMKREQSLTQSMQQKIIQGIPELTPAEIEKFYKKTPKDSLPIISHTYKLRQIVLYPNQDKAITEVKERLLSYRERVLKGERFSKLATLYSQDLQSASHGGELGMMSKDMLDPAFADAAIVLKPNQISPIVQSAYGFHIIQMIEKEGNIMNVRHILLRPNVDTDEAAKCIERLDSIKNAIQIDSITFEVAARNYSEDKKSKMSDGLLVSENSGATFFEKDMLKVADYNKIRYMKPGDISEPFESRDSESGDGKTIYKIIKLEQIIPSHIANIDQDYSIIQSLYKNNNAAKAIEEFINEKQKTTYIRIDPLFKECAFQRDGWFK